MKLMFLGNDAKLARDFESKFSELNDTLYSWYLLAVSKNIFPDGPQLAEKARAIASRLGVEDFKASNGWLDRWKKEHHLRKMTISGESGEVSGLTVDSWKERLPEIVQGYSSEDVCNLESTKRGSSGRHFLTRALDRRSRSVERNVGSELRLHSLSMGW